MVDGIQVELGGAELADYEARLISPPVTSVSLPVRIMKMLEDASASLGPAIQAGNITAEPGSIRADCRIECKITRVGPTGSA